MNVLHKPKLAISGSIENFQYSEIIIDFNFLKQKPVLSHKLRDLKIPYYILTAGGYFTKLRIVYFCYRYRLNPKSIIFDSKLSLTYPDPTNELKIVNQKLLELSSEDTIKIFCTSDFFLLLSSHVKNIAYCSEAGLTSLIKTYNL